MTAIDSATLRARARGGRVVGACGYRVVLDGDERLCNVTVPHTVHRFRTPDGRLHLFEIVPYGEAH